MTRKILITAATSKELDCIVSNNASQAGKASGAQEIISLVSGIGSIATIYSLLEFIINKGRPDIIINIGIAGSFNRNISPGTVVVPSADCFADLGFEDLDRFVPLEDTELMHDADNNTPSGFFKPDKDLLKLIPESLPLVKGITTNTVTGSDMSAEKLIRLYKADIETMEVAAVYYLCQKQGIPGIGFRAVSNMVGNRDKLKWRTEFALENLGPVVTGFIKNIVV